MDETYTSDDAAKKNALIQEPVAARALASAAVFGAIGAVLGRFLGARAQRKEHNITEPLFMWGMGAFWALLASYCSIKSSEQAEQVRLQNPAQPGPGDGVPLPTTQAKPVQGPHTIVETHYATHEGELATQGAHRALEK